MLLTPAVVWAAIQAAGRNPVDAADRRLMDFGSWSNYSM
jgi:hypothetical protein